VSDELLENVFTHSSWAPDRASSYERLEFLGDSVLELANLPKTEVPKP
jgi:dsRNA-specific ribonuclease